MLIPTVFHALQSGGEMAAREVARVAELELEDVYAELARLEALAAVDMRQARGVMVWFARPVAKTRRAA